MAEHNGILPICKPESFTSFDAVKKLRGMLKIKKIGHAGTLDPMATGVLPVFLGNATKACDLLPDQNKAYRVTFRLGLTSDTEDIWGEVLTETESHDAARQTHQQPCGHVRSLCGHCGNPWTHGSAADKIILFVTAVAVLQEEVETYSDNQGEIQPERNNFSV